MSLVREHETEPDLDDLPVATGDVVAAKYVVERVLGVGGMGAVVVARHRELGQRYALKVQRKRESRSKDTAARFLQEARAASRLTSPNAVRVVDFGTLPDGSPFLAMEYLEGVDLNVHLARSGDRLAVHETVGYMLDVCDALAEAHALGIIHRDLKPSNLFLASRPAGRPLVKVLDFGISKVLDSSISGQNEGLTRTQAVMGTPSYMAPEQWLDSKQVDTRADIWSLGVCMYRMLAGRKPFEAETAVELGAKLATQEPRPIRELRPDVPVELADAIHRCLAKKPESRFQTIAELSRVLEVVSRMPPVQAIVVPPAAPSDAPLFTAPTMTDYSPRSRTGDPAPPSRRGRESRAAVIALAVVALVAIVAATILGVSFLRVRSQVQTAATREEPPRATTTPAATPDIPSSAPTASSAASIDSGAPAAKKRPPAPKSAADPFPNER
jgi:serine/threonine-protein kinase